MISNSEPVAYHILTSHNQPDPMEKLKNRHGVFPPLALLWFEMEKYLKDELRPGE